MGLGTALRSLPRATARKQGNCQRPEDEPQLSRFDFRGYEWLVRAQIRRHMTVLLGAGDPSESPLCLEVFAAMLKAPET